MRPTFELALRRGVATGDHARGVASIALLPSNEFEPGVPLEGLAVDRVERTDVVADHDVVAEAVAGEALTSAVADVGRDPATGRAPWVIRCS